jgi:hypothetical protein
MSSAGTYTVGQEEAGAARTYALPAHVKALPCNAGVTDRCYRPCAVAMGLVGPGHGRDNALRQTRKGQEEVGLRCYRKKA